MTVTMATVHIKTTEHDIRVTLEDVEDNWPTFLDCPAHIDENRRTLEC